MSHTRIVNWNIERRKPSSWQAMSLVEEITGLKPDLICLTEAWTQSLSSLGGHTVSSPGVAWSPKHEDERKVLLWSPTPWRDAGVVTGLEETGSAVTGMTTLGGIETRVVGICIPYNFASPLGRTPKVKPWHQHESYLKKLKPLLDAWARQGPTIVLGDFNRRIPRVWGPRASYALLKNAFENYEIATAGVLQGVNDRTIDHVAHFGPFSTSAVTGRPAEASDGRRRSDHFGVVLDMII